MFKTLLIGIKDLKLIFRDRAALTFMLLAPFLLTLGLGFVTGRFSGNSGGLSEIPVVIVNQDNEQLGDALVDVFWSEELADLMEPSASTDPGQPAVRSTRIKPRPWSSSPRAPRVRSSPPKGRCSRQATSSRNSSDAAHVAQKIIETVSQPVPVEERDLQVTASIGISVFPEDGRDAETLIRNADAAMYHARRPGAPTTSSSPTR